MATVSGVWVWNSYPSFGNPSSSSGWHVEQNVNFTCNGSNFSEMTFYGESLMGARNININYDESAVYNYAEDRTGEMSGGWTNETYRTVDFGSTPQTVSDDFFEYLENYATPPAEPVPTPDWANCFVKTDSGNKAVEKVWIKQGNSLNVVWEAPAVTHKLFASEDMANNGGKLSLFINSKSYNLEGNSTDYVEIKTGDVIEGSAFISHNEFMALALKGVDTGTIYAQGDGGTDGANLDVSYTVPSTLTEDLIFVEVNV